MKATGEVMAIDRSFEAALMKAIRGLEIKQKDLRHVKMSALSDEDLRTAIRVPTDERLWALIDGLRRGWTVDEVNKISRVDRWFLRKLVKLVAVETRLVAAKNSLGASEDLGQLIQDAFLIGFPSPTLFDLLLDADSDAAYVERVKAEVERHKVQPVFKMVDTCAGEFESRTPYYYGTFEVEDDALTTVR